MSFRLLNQQRKHLKRIPTVVCTCRKHKSVIAQASNLATVQLNGKSNDILENRSLDFADYENAFKAKTTQDIVRALAVYRLCSIDSLVSRNKELIELSRKVLGKNGFNFVMKNSFYGHFVAGETQDDIKEKLSLMNKFGVGAILDYAVEADIPQKEPAIPEQTEESKVLQVKLDLSDVENRYKRHSEFLDRRQCVTSARTYFYEGEEKCDQNMKVFLDCIETTGNTSKNGFAAIKVTALGRPLMLLRLSQILNQTKYYFDCIVSCDEHVLEKQEIAEDRFYQGLKELGVDMTKEEAHRIFKIIDVNKNGGIDIIEWKNFLTPQLQLSKLFRAKPQVHGEVGKEVLARLSDEELKELENMQNRLNTIVQHAEKKGVRLMVDAEQSYFQPAISQLTLESMRKFNKHSATIFNTYQCYLKDTKTSVSVDMELSRREGFHFAAKLVRGAYMEQERFRAHSVGYQDPIHETYEATNECYNDVLASIIAEVSVNNANVMVATHNEQSVSYAIELMQKHRLHPDEQKVFFGQLLGMCDVITYALGSAGYSAYKYVPYGPVEEVMPYLSRRAMENRSLMKGVVKERHMLWAEFLRRFKCGELNHDPDACVD